MISLMFTSYPVLNKNITECAMSSAFNDGISDKIFDSSAVFTKPLAIAISVST